MARSWKKLTPQDLGQMQMDVNYFDRQVKLPHELPTVGIVLCRRKDKPRGGSPCNNQPCWLGEPHAIRWARGQGLVMKRNALTQILFPDE